MMRAKIELVLAFALICICRVNASPQNVREQKEPCKINDRDVFSLVGVWSGVSGEIIDDAYQGPLQTMTTSGIAEFNLPEDSKWLTFNYDPNAKTISIVTSDEFKNYENKAISKKFDVLMNIKCNNGEEYNVTYHQGINDINTYEPVWNNKEYVIEMYGSLKKGVYLSSFFELFVTDKDCSPDNILFTIENENNEEVKEIVFNNDKSSMEGKMTLADLVTITEIQAPFEATYIMKARDRAFEEDNKETTAKLMIRLKKSQMEFAFTKDEYSINVQKNKVVWDNTNPIEMREGVDHDIDVELVETEYSKYFSVKIDHLTGTILLQLEEPLPKPKNAYGSLQEFSLTLKATWQNQEVTTNVKVSSDEAVDVVCFVPLMDINRPNYENPKIIDDIYEGVVFSVEGIKNVIAMDCTKNEYLFCEFDQAKGEFRIVTTEAYKKYEEVEVNTTIRTNLMIKCPYETKELEFNQPIRDTNNHAPKFSQETYSFIFYTELLQNYTLTLINAITAMEVDLTTDVCNFGIEEDTEEIFSIKSAKEGKLCTAEISVSKAITNGFDKTFKLVVNDGTTEHTDSAEIHLKIIKDDEGPKFTQEEYYMKIDNSSNNQYLKAFDNYDVPKLANGLDQETQFEIPDAKLAQLFKLAGNQLTGNLDVEVVSQVGLCEDCEALSVPIKATWRGGEAKSKLTIILSEDGSPPPSSSTTESSGGSQTPTGPTGSTEGSTQGGQLAGFSVFMMSSLVGIMMMFVISTVVLCGMLYMIVRHLRVKRKVASVIADPDVPL